jgi:hypothetical protein
MERGVWVLGLMVLSLGLGSQSVQAWSLWDLFKPPTPAKVPGNKADVGGKRNLEQLQDLDVLFQEIGQKTRWIGANSSDSPALCVLPFALSHTLANDQGTVQIWHPQPRFFWMGPVKTIELQQIEAPDQQSLNQPLPPIWTKSIGKTVNAIAYDGLPLIPGGDYRIVFRSDRGPSGDRAFSFTVPEETGYEEIREGLEQVRPIQKPGVEPDAEALLVKEAAYLLKLGLSFDAMQKILAVEQPSQALIDRVKTWSYQTCGASNGLP